MSKIEWTGKTWNPVTGCEYVSPGCKNCYAVAMTRRNETMHPRKYAGLINEKRTHFNGVVKCHDHALAEPDSYKKPKTFFLCSMADLFHISVPVKFIAKVFDVMESCPRHTFQVLTKRTTRMVGYLWRRTTLPNVWAGTSIENQATADDRIPTIAIAHAAIRFLSVEPLLEEVDLGDLSGIDWLIVGGESGPAARPMEIRWLESIIEQCRAAAVPLFVKQLGTVWANIAKKWGRFGIHSKGGNPEQWPKHLRIREMPESKTERIKL